MPSGAFENAIILHAAVGGSMLELRAPHAAYYSQEAIRTVRDFAAHEVVRVLTGQQPLSPVTADQLAGSRPRLALLTAARKPGGETPSAPARPAPPAPPGRLGAASGRGSRRPLAKIIFSAAGQSLFLLVPYLYRQVFWGLGTGAARPRWTGEAGKKD